LILRHHSLLPFRLLLLTAAVFLVATVVAFDGRKPDGAQADPAFGLVRPNPTSGVIIENHIFPLNVQMTTCADNAVIPGGTATSGALTTITDSTKSWTTNQWAGYDIQLTTGAQAPQWRSIVSNTGTTITVDSAWGGIVDTGTADGGSTTTLLDVGSGWFNNEFVGMTLEMPSKGVGQNRTISANTVDTLTVSPAWTTNVTDTASAALTTTEAASTLMDTSVSWSTNAWANKTVQINSGGAAGQSRRIISNTSNKLTIEGTWTATTGGSATAGATSNTFVDATKSWAVNSLAGLRIDIISGTGANQSRTITSNTATTITISSNWTTIPAFGDLYRVLAVPTTGATYIVRDGPSIGTAFQIKQNATPTGGTQFQIFKSHCRPGGHTTTVAYPSAKFEVITDAGIGTSGSSTTLVDSSKNWKINQWAGSRVNINVGAGAGQSRVVLSNTKTALTVTPAWSVPNPGSGSVYQIGGIGDGGFITSTGRAYNCPGGATYGTGTASINCVSLGSGGTNLPQGPTGAGNLVNVILKATGRGVSTFSLTSQVLEVDGTIIPADVANANRRVILCPDSAPPASPDGLINVADLGSTSQAFGQGPGGPNYTPQKNPNEDSIINVADLGIIASVFGKRCIQP
jgi:hypothetical protein